MKMAILERFWLYNFLYVYKYWCFYSHSSVFLFRREIGWAYGFGAAGVGMFFGVLQYINFKHLLGDAGKNLASMPQAHIETLISRRSKITAGTYEIWAYIARIHPFDLVFSSKFCCFLRFRRIWSTFHTCFCFAGLTEQRKRDRLIVVGILIFFSLEQQLFGLVLINLAHH